MAPISVWSAIGLALALVASAQAAPLKRPPLHKRDFNVTERGEGNGGCGPYYYRGAGGNCVQGDGSKWYHPDPYWTPCDYSIGSQYPEGCGGD
jgi:hypothetical protein